MEASLLDLEPGPVAAVKLTGVAFKGVIIPALASLRPWATPARTALLLISRERSVTVELQRNGQPPAVRPFDSQLCLAFCLSNHHCDK